MLGVNINIFNNSQKLGCTFKQALLMVVDNNKTLGVLKDLNIDYIVVKNVRCVYNLQLGVKYKNRVLIPTTEANLKYSVIYGVKSAVRRHIDGYIQKNYTIVYNKFINYCVDNSYSFRNHKQFVNGFIKWLYGCGDALDFLKNSKQLVDFLTLECFNSKIKDYRFGYSGLDVFLKNLFIDFEATISSTGIDSFINYKTNDVFYYNKVDDCIIINNAFLKELMLWYIENNLNYSGVGLYNFRYFDGFVVTILKKYGYAYKKKRIYCANLKVKVQRCLIIHQKAVMLTS